MRELEALLWQAIARSPGRYVDLHEGIHIDGCLPDPGRRPVDPDSIPPEVIRESFERHNGYQDAVWRELDLPNRFALYRLLKRQGIVVRKADPDHVP